jgi:putative phage-type endonuclease
MPLSPEQREARRHVIGGSDASKLFGPNPSPIKVYASKVLELDEDDTNDAAELGTEFEPIIRRRAALRLGVQIDTPTTMITHPKYPWMGANLDGIIVGDRGIWEGKCLDLRKANRLGPVGTDHVLEEHFFQGQHYLEVGDYDWAAFTYLVGGNDERDFIVHRDREIGEWMVEEERRFWMNHVEPRIPPSAENPYELTAYLTRAYAKANGERLRAPPGSGAEEALRELRDKRAARKAALREEEVAKARVMSLMGAATVIECEFGRVAWNESRRAGWMDIAKALNAPRSLVEKHTKSSRRFTPRFDNDADDASED